ncbi:hypothetical protein V2W45_1473413 [Cenococcum geophilum]
METLAIIGLVGNIVQFVDFSGKLVSKSTELYRSSEGALAENSDIETAINHLVLLNNKLKDAATTTGDSALQSLCKSCGTTADQLLAVLDKVKVKGKQGKWKSIRKALRSVWSKEEIEELGQRLERFREELNLHVTVDLREDVRQFMREGSDRLKDLDITTKRIVDAIIKQEDVFRTAHNTQITLMGTIHEETVSKVQDEHAITRREIIQEIRVRSLSGVNTILLNSGQRREQDMSAANQGPCLATSCKACWYVPLARNKKFVGRSAQLNELEANLFTEGHCPKFAIIGLGGVGKTQIALELAYRIREKHPDCSVFWVPATSAENLQQAYVGVGQQLRIIGLEDKEEDIKKLVQHHLSQENAGQWLLIMDNADDMDMWFKKSDINTNTTRLIDYLPRSSKGSIVFTTRSRKAAVKFADRNVIQVTEMDRDAATQVLRNSLINKEISNDHAVVQLLRQLTFLPLAIVQAAAYINENDISLAEYLSLLDDREENIVEVLSEDFEDEGRYHDIKNPIATTWLISFEQIRIRDALAADYLSFMSCIDPKAIPLSLLPPAQSKKKIIDAIGTLSAYSFITKRPDNQSLDIHRLVHLATRNWLRAQNLLSEWIAKAIAQLADVFPNDNHKNRILWRTYLPHAQYVYAPGLFQENFKGSLLLFQKFGLCLLSDGRWDEAEQPFMQVMEASARVLGKDHPSTLTSMANLASTFWNQGRWKEAEELEVQVMEMRKRNQGRWKEAEELKVQEAEELNVQVMETRKRVLGQEHPDTLTSMANLVSMYRNQGRWKEAEELEVQVMETRKRVLGHEHPDTLTTMNNLAFTWKLQCRDNKALALMEECFKLRKKKLGPDHPNTMSSLRALNEWQMEKLALNSVIRIQETESNRS